MFQKFVTYELKNIWDKIYGVNVCIYFIEYILTIVYYAIVYVPCAADERRHA